MQLRRILATTLSAACLLTACSGEDGGNSGTTGGVTALVAPVERVWTAAISSFNEAFNDYARFHRDVYLHPLPDEVSTEEEMIAYITDIHQELAQKLAVLVDLHQPLGPGLKDAISQGVISPEEVSDFREYVELTGRWTTIQQRLAQDSLICLERNPDELEPIQVCVRALIFERTRPLLDELAAHIHDVGRRLFGTAWIAP